MISEYQQQLKLPLNQEDSSRHRSSFFSNESREFLIHLEGECKIKDCSLMKINYLKVIFFLIPCALTFIGFLLLYHYRNVRVKLAFTSITHAKDFGKVTHVYVKSTSGIDAICRLYKVKTSEKTFTLFRFQQLIYELNSSEYLPLGMYVKQEIRKYLKDQSWLKGLSTSEVSQSKQLYGKNEHLVKIPSYHEYMFNNLTNYKISILYLNVLITLLEYSPIYAMILIGFSLFIINLNYILTIKFYRKIKQTAEKDYHIRVQRQGTLQKILKSQLVPGDIYLIDEEIPCDSIILKGSTFVNEVGFTGENIPVGKFALEQVEKTFQSQHWVYEGSPIISHKKDTYAVAINTAFSSRKGKIIRKILHASPAVSEYFKSMLPFIGEVVVVHVLLFAIFFQYMFENIDNKSIIWLRFGEFMISSIPGFLQIQENLYQTIYLIKFNSSGVIGTNCEKTIESSRVSIVCFDKTGTLTENTVEIQQLLLPVSTDGSSDPQFRGVPLDSLPTHGLLHRLFASCHAVQELGGKFHGDEIDLKMFLAAGVALRSEGVAEQCVFEAEGSGVRLEVRKVHQFESRFQSMSVLVRDRVSGERFVFAKGSPEKLHALSETQFTGFPGLIKELSLEGYRSIAVSARRVESEAEFERLASGEREECLRGTRLLALVTFANKLKEEAPQIIRTLAQAAIATKIVTGDNIFVAVQTALALGMVPEGERIIALEGHRLAPDGSIRAVAVRRVEGRITEEELLVGDLGGSRLDGEFLAMDFEFVKRCESFFLGRSCTVFARATPEMKAVIVQKEKEKIEAEYRSRSWGTRLFGGRIRKVAMVGDGANDLMAIREAHVGIGISDSDAVYSADFTISNLNQIDLIIRESKAGEQKLLELTQFYYIYRFMDMTCKILQTADFALYPPNTGIIRNFLIQYSLCIILVFGQTSDKPSKYYPSFNMLSLQNQLIYWGSSLIVGIGISFDYYYYRSTPDFQPSPDRSKLTFLNKTGTVTILLNIVLSIFISISIVQSNPWKKKIWKNIPGLVFLSINTVLITTFMFITKDLGGLGLLPIDETQALRMYFIAIGFGILCFLFNFWVQSKHLYKNQ